MVEGTPTRYLTLFELLLYAAGCGFGAYKGGEELHLALTEPEPTPISLDRFDEDHDGQRWLALRGRFLWEHKHVHQSGHEAHDGKDLAYIHVPVVRTGWKPGEPVRAVAVFGPAPRGEVDQWLKQQQRLGANSVQGLLRSGMYKLEESFPKLTFVDEDDVLVVNQGTEPLGLAAAFALLGIFLIFLVLLIRKLRIVWKG